MQVKHAIVINEQGYKTEFCLVDIVINADGTVTEVPQYYTLKPGESFVYDGIGNALSMLKPRWDGSAWTETATQQEIEAAIPPLMEPQKAAPTNLELDEKLTLVMNAIAEIHEATGLGASDAMAEVYAELINAGVKTLDDVEISNRAMVEAKLN
ncbi:MAG: hypothetical protein FWF44_07450 [Defluviitaleaceae bacterium]|nr:hypothetical protein [Defluviitaleaceae bacterium]